MAKFNQMQSQNGFSLSKILERFKSKLQRADALTRIQLAMGFERLSCGCSKRCRLEHRDLPCIKLADPFLEWDSVRVHQAAVGDTVPGDSSGYVVKKEVSAIELAGTSCNAA